MQKSKKVSGLVTAVIVVLSAIFVTVIYTGGESEPKVSIENGHIRIKAMYGTEIAVTEVESVALIDKSMSELRPGARTNGYAGFGQTLKGNFKSDQLGETLLFVQSETSPTIRIERIGSKDVYISFRDAEQTQLLYEQLAVIVKR